MGTTTAADVNIPYKICILGKNNVVKKLILFTDEENADYGRLFHDKELEFISENSIKITFSKQQIHKDDSISAIKNKLLKELDYSVSYYELYLFSNIQKKYNLQQIFENVSEKKDYIDKSQFKQLLVNLGTTGSVLENIDKNKTKFFAEDLLSISESLHPDNVYYKVSIGKRFRFIHDELFSTNPYDILATTSLIHRSTNPFESFENQLLFNTNNGEFVDNTIYVCFAEDVLEFSKEMNLNSEKILSLYFPFLAKQEIVDLESLEESRDQLIKKTKKMASKRAFQTYESVDLLYDIYHTRLGELPYETKGVEVFSLYIHPEFAHILPLDVIFKNVHSTKTIPFIKYNPGFKRENIYRFYSEEITKYGTKIPFLSARTILKLAKETGRKKQISFSIENSLGDFYIDIATNGDIHISGNNFKTPIDISELNGLIQEIANPVIEHMNDFLRKNGYEIKKFSDIRNKHIEIEYLKYVSSMKIKKEIDLAKYKGCLNSIFEMDGSVASLDINKGVKLRFKRVENYSDMDEEDIFIAGLYGKQITDREIAEAISKKYDMTMKESTLRLAQFIRDHERVQGRYVKTSFKLSDSPGFLVEMAIHSYEDLFSYSVEFDNSSANIYLDYVDVIQMYMDSLLRITQDPKSSAVSSSTISRICSKEYARSDKSEKLENVVVGIQAESEVQDIANQFMFSEIGEEDEELGLDEKGADISVTEGVSAFGDLNEYENSNIEDVEDIEKYESSADFELLSPIEDESKSISVGQSASKSASKSASESNDLMFFGEGESESEGEREGESESESEDKGKGEENKEQKTGGVNSVSSSSSNSKNTDSRTITKKLDGMILKENNNNLFLSRLKKRQPTLFVSEEDGKYNAYATLCQASQNRQPVILTQSEKDKIDKKDAQNKSKSYNHALQYGVNGETPYWYICPRYWCLKTNSSITQKEVEEGKCGKVIPKGAKTVPKGHYVYEFNHPIQHHKKNGDYNENTPGFLESSLHSKGLCLPCCFKKEWNSKSQSDRRKECNATTGEQTDAVSNKGKEKGKGKEKETRPKNVKQEEYVYEIRRYPIPQKRWGFLPIAVQLLLQTDNSLSVNPDNNKYLRDDRTTETLLRFGVENSSKKSFIACIADVYAYKRGLAQVPTIDEMCMLISEAITIDMFLKYHNGSLASIFKPKLYDIDRIDPTKYESSEFIRKLDMGNETHIDFINDTIAAFENFLEFLKSSDSYIDHTYLWDIVCSPNPNLFQTGCNLAILRIKDADIRDDIEILCPTSIYSSILYDMRKETVILLKHDEYYEPIYLFNYMIGPRTSNSTLGKSEEFPNLKKELRIQKTFLENSSVENIREVLQIIRNSIQNYCAPQSSMPRQYKFKKSMPLEKLYTTLMKYEFVILAQVLNYQGKVIGLFIKYKETGLMIPCFPSAQMQEIPVKFMDDDSLWLDYRTTRDALLKIHAISKGEILCKPTHKILEDGLVIGILTETNQFIQLSVPTENIYEDGIVAINDENYIIADKTITQSKTEDMERVKTVKMISLETQFFAAFRSTVRMLISQTVNKYYKQQIVEIIENPRYLYKSKLATVERILRKVCEKYVSFKEFDQTLLLSLDEISDCFSNTGEKKYCILQKSGEPAIVLPEKHLISGLNNRNIYFARIADEFVRYKRIQLFLLDPKIYLNITNTEYKINEDEMLMLESLLTSDYFKSIEPYEHSKHTKITYETANPIITQKYSNEISQTEQKEMIMKDRAKEDLQDKLGIECIQVVYTITGNARSEWKSFFPKNSTESQLHKSVKCSYYPIIYVYNEIYKTVLTVEQVKVMLAEKYAKFDQEKVFMILRTQGKRDMIDDIRKGKYSFETAIASEVYFLTTLDFWVLSSSLKLPIILFHQSKLKHLIETVNWLKLSLDNMPHYYFVRVATEPDYPGNYLPQYTIVRPPIKTNSAEMVKKLKNANPDVSISIENYFQRVTDKSPI